MSYKRIATLGLILVLATPAAYYGWRYFFDPKGIDISDGEICASNESGQDLVMAVEAKPGARIIALVETGQILCAPSPIDAPSGVVTAGQTEDTMVCAYTLEAPDRLPFVTRYFEEGRCDWGEVVR